LGERDMMIAPFLVDEHFLADVAAARGEPARLHLWWLGQSGFLVQWQGRHLLLDPYLSDSLTQKYANTDKPHIRMTGRVIAPERLDFIDVVTSSHNHTDHLDAETLLPLMRANPRLQMVIAEANRAFVIDRLGCDPAWPHGLDAGQRLTITPFTITGVPAAHEHLEQDAAGRHRFLGYLIEAGPWIIYHSGDTVWYPGLVEALQPYAIDVALLPINGAAPERRVAGNLDGPEAARLARMVNAGLVIPCHYEMFTFNTASPEAFVAECQRLGQPYHILRAGERWSSIRS
jgi:L-ascorbate metabolism protein UlaG (beta-lactamase superfamily)